MRCVTWGQEAFAYLEEASMNSARAVLFAFMLFAAACAAGTPAATDAPAQAEPATEVTEDSHAEEGDDHADEAHEEEAHEEGSTQAEEAHEDEAHEEEEPHEDVADHTEEHEDGDHDEAAEADRVVEVVLTEFAIEMSDTRFSAGETVLFEVVNEGAIEHEFRLSNAHRIEEHLEGGHEDHDATGHHGDGDVFVHLLAGEDGHLLVTFSDDTEFFTEAACLLPGHYEAEMKADIIVSV